MTISPRRVPLVLLIMGVALAVFIAVGGLSWWWAKATDDRRAEDTARWACDRAIRNVGGDPTGLRLAATSELDGSKLFWFDRVKINGRAANCLTQGFALGGIIAGVSLSYWDDTPVLLR